MSPASSARPSPGCARPPRSDPRRYAPAHGALGPAHARRRRASAEDPALRARRGAVDPDQAPGRRGAAGAPGPRARLCRRDRRRGGPRGADRRPRAGGRVRPPRAPRGPCRGGLPAAPRTGPVARGWSSGRAGLESTRRSRRAGGVSLMAEITFNGVWKRYPDGFEAVKDMNLEVQDGEFMILVGPSGCGKSTALRMVAGLEEITDGDLRIGGETVNALPPKERDVAMVFQNYALYPHMSVRDNMGFALKLRGVEGKEIDKKVSEAARVLDLEEHLDRKPSQLSGGQRQRVAMGRAIVRDPAAFLMDEPLSNLDAKLRVQMRAEVSRIQQRLGTTTIYVTHDQTEALTLGDRVAVMRSGVVQQVGQPMELYNEPANLFVA